MQETHDLDIINRQIDMMRQYDDLTDLLSFALGSNRYQYGEYIHQSDQLSIFVDDEFKLSVGEIKVDHERLEQRIGEMGIEGQVHLTFEDYFDEFVGGHAGSEGRIWIYGLINAGKYPDDQELSGSFVKILKHELQHIKDSELGILQIEKQKIKAQQRVKQLSLMAGTLAVSGLLDANIAGTLAGLLGVLSFDRMISRKGFANTITDSIAGYNMKEDNYRKDAKERISEQRAYAFGDQELDDDWWGIIEVYRGEEHKLLQKNFYNELVDTKIARLQRAFRFSNILAGIRI